MELPETTLSAVHVLATCSSAKRAHVPTELRVSDLAEVGPRSPEVAVQTWVDRLEASHAVPHEAIGLYKGDRWKVVTNLATDYPTWISSAGYGLVPSDAPLKPYGATFSPRETDAVSRLVAAPNPTAAWWNELARWPGPIPSSPRSISSLAERVGRLVAILSPPYLAACEADLLGARAILGPERLIVVTSVDARMEGAVIAERKMNKALGGNDITISVRLARWLLGELGDDITTTGATILAERMAASLPDDPRAPRQPVNDAFVVSFVKERLVDSPGRSATSLLGEFRSELGFACEQKRFHALVRETKEALRDG